MDKVLKQALEAWKEYDKTGILPERMAKKKKVLISINESVFLKFKSFCEKKDKKVSPEIEGLVKKAIAK